MSALARFAWRYPVLTVAAAGAVVLWAWLSRPWEDDDPALAWWQQRQAGDEDDGQGEP